MNYEPGDPGRVLANPFHNLLAGNKTPPVSGGGPADAPV
jgi:hypothetical protein